MSQLPDTSLQRVRALECIARRGFISRQDIADITGMPIQGVCGRVAELLESGAVVEDGTKLGRFGKTQALLRVRRADDQISEAAAVGQPDLFGVEP